MDMVDYVSLLFEFDEVCRICLKVKNDMRPLFGSDLEEKLNAVAGIKIDWTKEDGFPNLLCLECVDQCNRAYTFRRACERSITILQQYLSSGFQVQLLETIGKDQAVLSNKLHENVDSSNICRQVAEEATDEYVYKSENNVEEKEEFTDIKETEIDIVDVKDKDEEESNYTEFKFEVTEEEFNNSASAVEDIEGDLEGKEEKSTVATVESNHSCLTCGKSFRLAVSLANHIKSHKNKIWSSCMYCGKQFRKGSQLKSHIWTHMNEETNECKICNKTFIQQSDIKKHLNVHTGNKPYQCGICHKSFSMKGSLKTHQRVHTGEKPYGCHLCDKTFIQSSNLSNHLRTHTGEKPFECDICHKNFKQSSNLIVHLRIHTGEEPYKCDFCHTTFKQCSNLLLHIRRVHRGERPYKCNFCDKTFVQSPSLKKHLKNHEKSF